MNTDSARELPRIVWLWIVPLPFLFHLAMRQIDSDGEFFSRWVESESGIIENATALILIPATIFAIGLALHYHRKYGPAYLIWFTCAAFVCFGFAGEEVSWGQHWLGWHSPEYFVQHNLQGETNLHNMNRQLGRVVKSILTLLIIIGGLIMPFRYLERDPHETRFRRFMNIVTPTMACVPAAALVLGIRLVERFKTWFDLDWSIIAVNLKESQELYIAIFLVLYLWSAHTRKAED